MTYTLKDLQHDKGIGWKYILRDLNEIMRSIDRECQLMYMNRLNGLRSGKLTPRPLEIQAVLAYSGNLVESYKD